MSGHLTREEKDKWGKEVIDFRLNAFEELKEWLRDNNIPYTSANYYGIEVADMKISNVLKVRFNGTRKLYQYNLEKIKERLS